MNRIEESFGGLKAAGRKGFIPYITAGYPDMAATEELIRRLDAMSVTAIEIGIPFSDPIADGRVIQEASLVAIQNGATLKKILNMLEKLRKDVSVPFVIFSYCNPVYKMGFEAFGYRARECGVDGVLILDLPVEEMKTHLCGPAFKHLERICLVTPTTPRERMEQICSVAGGFVYAVSRLGVTGMSQTVSGNASALVREIRRHTQLPIALGFGVSTAEQVREISGYADAVVVGSAIVSAMEKAGREGCVDAACACVAELMKGLS